MKNEMRFGENKEKQLKYLNLAIDRIAQLLPAVPRERIAAILFKKTDVLVHILNWEGVCQLEEMDFCSVMYFLLVEDDDSSTDPEEQSKREAV